MLDALKTWTPVNKRFLAIGLALTITAQLLVLATEFLGSVWPIWFGTPVTLQTEPIDPRSLFRGNYVRLNYAVSTIDQSKAEGALRRGEVGYVTLRKEGDFYIASGLQREQPASGVFIRGRVVSDGARYRMNYGIEAYFMPREKALQAERWVRDGARAEIFLLSNGKAAIASLQCDDANC